MPPGARVDVNGGAFPDMSATYAVVVRVEQPWGFIGPAVMTLGGATAVGGSFAVWLRTGAVRRSSYEILGLVDRLGFAPDGPIRTAVRGWPLMPLVVTASVVAAWWGLRQVAAALGIVGGLYAGALGIAIASAVPGHRLVSVTAAPTITAIGAAVQIVGSVLAIAVRSSALEVETAEVTNATRPDPRAPHATLPGGRS
jgi:hypothetical protein